MVLSSKHGDIRLKHVIRVAKIVFACIGNGKWQPSRWSLLVGLRAKSWNSWNKQYLKPIRYILWLWTFLVIELLVTSHYDIIISILIFHWHTSKTQYPYSNRFHSYPSNTTYSYIHYTYFQDDIIISIFMFHLHLIDYHLIDYPRSIFHEHPLFCSRAPRYVSQWIAPRSWGWGPVKGRPCLVVGRLWLVNGN